MFGFLNESTIGYDGALIILVICCVLMALTIRRLKVEEARIKENLAEVVEESDFIALQLARKQSQFQLLFNALPAIITYLDKDLRYVMANAHFKTLHGMSPSQMVGKHV